MSSLTIIVPRIGLDSDFETTLASVLRYRLPHHQVIVVQGPDQTDQYGLDDEVEFVEGTSIPGLGRFVNAAMPKVRGDVVNILKPGVEVINHWFAYGIRQLQHASNGCVAVPLVARQDRQQILSYGIAPTRRMSPRHSKSARKNPVGPSCWAGFYRRSLLQQLGAQDEFLCDEFFGLDIGLSLARLGYRCAVTENHVLTVQEASWLADRPSVSIGRDAQRMIERHRCTDSVSPGDWIAGVADIAMCLTHPRRLFQLAGRSRARKRQATDRGYYGQLEILRQQLESEKNAEPVADQARRAA